MNRRVEIICVGNELLTGHTLNTNAQWIAEKVTHIGGVVQRVTVVRDEVSEIKNSIRDSLKRKPSSIIITGGLGPTYDDKTLQGLGRALSKKLVVNKQALQTLREKYSKTSDPTLSAPRYKMTTIPAGSVPLSNIIGHAPGVMIKQRAITIFAVPGVPREMKSVISRHVLPRMRKRFGRFVRVERSWETTGIMESQLSPFLDVVVAKNPKVYIKSHPKTYRNGVSILNINIIAEAKNRNLAERYLSKAAKELKFYIEQMGGSMKKF